MLRSSIVETRELRVRLRANRCRGFQETCIGNGGGGDRANSAGIDALSSTRYGLCINLVTWSELYYTRGLSVFIVIGNGNTAIFIRLNVIGFRSQYDHYIFFIYRYLIIINLFTTGIWSSLSPSLPSTPTPAHSPSEFPYPPVSTSS